MGIRNNVLQAVLRCDEHDLERLDAVRYSWDTIVEKMNGLAFLDGLTGIMRAVLAAGIEEICLAIGSWICELEAIPNERPLDKEEKEDLSILRSLDPDKDIELGDDLIVRMPKIYQFMLPGAVEEFCHNTGLAVITK